MDNGIKSKDRVKDFGEVFTPDKIVNDMLNLVDEQIKDLDYITTIFLEPACGDGQFLIRILYRKLLKVLELPVAQRPLALVKALSSIYAVDIQADNVKEARERLFKVATSQEVTTFDLDNKIQTIKIELGIEFSEQLKTVINTILDWNIMVGNTLQPDTVVLKSYHFNGTKVSVADATLNALSFEYNATAEVDFISLPSLITTEDDSDEFDF